MAGPRFVALLGLVAVAACMALGAPKGAEAAVTCGEVVRSLLPCVSYVQNGGAVPDTCCNGIRTLNGMAKATSEKRSVCGCLKSAVGGVSFSSRTANLAAGLPKKCGVNIPFKISPSTDCNSVK